MLAPSTVVVLALATAGLAPWMSPPSSTVPPPAGPLASRAAPFSTTRWPVTSMRPPLPAWSLAVAPAPMALTWPATTASLVALMRITPPSTPAGNWTGAGGLVSGSGSATAAGTCSAGV